MTKTSIFGQNQNQKETVKNPIQLLKWLQGDGKFVDANSPAHLCQNIVLLEKKYCGNMDLIWTHSDRSPNSGSLFLGHWNDGVV